jgi:ferredoxin
MNVKLIYFSGTGNSLALTRMIASKMPGAEIIPAITLLNQPGLTMRADSVGFLFPVYYLDVPEIMKGIMLKMDIAQVEYIFSAATCGGDSGNSFHTLNRILQAKGKRLHLGVEVPIGDNSIVYTTPKSVLDERIARLDELSADIARRVSARETDDQPAAFNTGSAVMKQVYRVALNGYYQIGRKSVISERCTACGLCARVCPAGNIHIVDWKVTWQDQCESCFACLNWCPRQAIRFGKIEMTHRTQYRFPGMKAGDVIVEGLVKEK